MKPKKRRRIFAGFLAVVLASFSLSLGNVQAGPETEEDMGIQARLCTASGEPAEKMEFGQFMFLEFTLPQNLDVKAELFLPNLDQPLGFLYAVSYQEHMRNLGSQGEPDYQWKQKIKEEEFLAEWETLFIQGFYEKTSRISGIGSSKDSVLGENVPNYLLWKGQYIPADESYPRYVKPGCYELRITPLDSGLSSQAVCIPLEVLGSGEAGALSQEDVQTVLDREETCFPKEHMHVLDTLTDPKNCQVSLQTGEMVWQEQDIPADGEGTLPFVRYHRTGRYYHDKGLNLAGLGDLWTHSYSYFAEIYRMDVIIYLPGGQILNFRKEYRRGWQNYDDARYRLGKTEDGFILQIPEGGAVFFNEKGRPSKMLQADGTELHFFYAGDDQLYRISSDTDELRFTYKNERLTQVSNDRGDKIQFHYENGSSEVAAVSGKDEAFHYQYDDHRQMLNVLDEAGNTEMEVVYGEYSNMTGRAKVEVLHIPKEEIFRTYVYNDQEKLHICQEKDGNALAMVYENNYGAEYTNCTWTIYNKRGNPIRSSEASGKTTVY